VYPATSITDLSAVDVALMAMEFQFQAIKERLLEETLAIPKAKGPKYLSLSLCFYFSFFFFQKWLFMNCGNFKWF
jgi:hypothetical protein